MSALVIGAERVRLVLLETAWSHATSDDMTQQLQRRRVVCAAQRPQRWHSGHGAYQPLSLQLLAVACLSFSALSLFSPFALQGTSFVVPWALPLAARCDMRRFFPWAPIARS